MTTMKTKADYQTYQLNDLMQLSENQLDEIFLTAPGPQIADLNGEYQGRVLAAPFFPLNETLGVQYVNNDLLPWKGKAFTPLTNAQGEGKNRIELGPFKTQTFYFRSCLEPSLLGGDSCFVLDYDVEGNPVWLRQIRDELKKLKDNLFLGRAYFKWQGKHEFVLYFALGK